MVSRASEGDAFNTYQRVTGDRHYEDVLVKAADRMICGTLGDGDGLKLSNIIEIGEYAHFALLAWKTRGLARFRTAADRILAHIERNFDSTAGMWRPFDIAALRRDPLTHIIRPVLRFSTLHLPLRGRMVARLSDRLATFAVIESFPQYAMSLMDAEALLDTLDGSCALPSLGEQTRRAIEWVENNCKGPFLGSLTESKAIDRNRGVYPIPIINDTRMAALWPTTCLLIAYCSMNDVAYRDSARSIAEWILTMQDEYGAFSNFRNPDGSLRSLQSGNVNFYASMALWLFNEVYNNGHSKLFTGSAVTLRSPTSSPSL